MLYLLPSDGKDLSSNPVADNLAPAPCSTAQGVVEDEVDQILDKEDGKIYRFCCRSDAERLVSILKPHTPCLCMIH